jgi:hypothetical protein
VLSPPASARTSLQLPREGGPGTAAGTPDHQQPVGAASTAATAAAAAAPAATGLDTRLQQGVLAVRVAHTKLDYAAGGPLLPASVEPGPPFVAAARPACCLLGSPSHSAEHCWGAQQGPEG